MENIKFIYNDPTKYIYNDYYVNYINELMYNVDPNLNLRCNNHKFKYYV